MSLVIINCGSDDKRMIRISNFLCLLFTQLLRAQILLNQKLKKKRLIKNKTFFINLSVKLWFKYYFKNIDYFSIEKTMLNLKFQCKQPTIQ